MSYVARGCMYCEGECTKECLKELKKAKPQNPAVVGYTPKGSSMMIDLLEMYKKLSLEEKNEVVKRLSK